MASALGHAGEDDRTAAAPQRSAGPERRRRHAEDLAGPIPEGIVAAGARHLEWAAQSMRRPRVGIPAAVVAVVVVAGIIVALAVRGGGLPANAAFSVGGKVTTVAEFNSQTQALDNLQGVTPPAQSDPKAYGVFLRSAAKALAVQQLIGAVAHKRGIVVSQKTTRDVLDQLVTTSYGGDRTKFDQVLSQSGVTEPQALSALNSQEVENRLYAKVTHTVTITDAQVSAAFTANQASLTSPEQRTLSHIVVATQSEAQMILTQAASGTAFTTLAQQDSLDTATKANGGALGTVSATQLSSPFGPAAFSAALNVPFGPVQESGGAWDVGLVTAIVPAVTYSDDTQTQAAIKNYLSDQQLRSQWLAYLGAQIKHADIIYEPRYRPTDPLSPPQPALPSLLDFVVNAHTSATAPSATTSTPVPAPGATAAP